jgi:DNA phosphorothioation-dependent restriction protein DptG
LYFINKKALKQIKNHLKNTIFQPNRVHFSAEIGPKTAKNTEKRAKNAFFAPKMRSGLVFLAFGFGILLFSAVFSANQKKMRRFWRKISAPGKNL